MCYSIETVADYLTYVERYSAHLSLREFDRLVKRARKTGDLLLPTQVESALLADPNPDLAELQDELRIDRTERIGKAEMSLAELRMRLQAAQEKLAKKATKTALNEQRIATNKIGKAQDKLDALLEVPGTGSKFTRVFSQKYAPVLVVENGERVILPMRYQCRPPGVPEKWDVDYPGTYNARLDTIMKPGSSWRRLFMHYHGIVEIRAFHENVHRHDWEHRQLAPGENESNVRLRFTPDDDERMIVPVLWSRWTKKGEPDLLSFAVITNDPPPEVQGAGHDRCPMQIKPEHVEAWLTPQGRTVNEILAILNDKPDVRYVPEESGKDE